MGDPRTRATGPKDARPAFLDTPIEESLGLHARRDPADLEEDFGYRFYVDVLGLYVTEEDDEAIYLRSTEEFIHHNLVLRKGPIWTVGV